MTTLYLFFGAQGSGKSTQGRRLAQKLGLPFFDTGDQLRHLSAVNTPIGQTIKQQMMTGQLVNNDIVMMVIKNFLASQATARGLVMDGFPRNLGECRQLEDLARRRNWPIVSYYITISDQTVNRRLTKRAAIENRTDDQPAVIAERLQAFKAETLPVIDYLKNQHQLVVIDGEPDIDRVTRAIYTSLNQ